jgi:hypothetical protein
VLKNSGMSCGLERKTKQTRKLLVFPEKILGFASINYVMGVEY